MPTIVSKFLDDPKTQAVLNSQYGLFVSRSFMAVSAAGYFYHVIYPSIKERRRRKQSPKKTVEVRFNDVNA